MTSGKADSPNGNNYLLYISFKICTKIGDTWSRYLSPNCPHPSLSTRSSFAPLVSFNARLDCLKFSGVGKTLPWYAVF